jgi:hypothetical protein
MSGQILFTPTYNDHDLNSKGLQFIFKVFHSYLDEDAAGGGEIRGGREIAKGLL